MIKVIINLAFLFALAVYAVYAVMDTRLQKARVKCKN